MTPTGAYVAALVLAGMFLWAAVAKAMDQSGTRAAFAGLALPLPGVLAWLVPLGEATLGVVLLAQPRLGSMITLVTLAGFSAILWRARARGQVVGCGCFGGGRSDTPLAINLLRNGLLAVFALAGFWALPALPRLVDVIVVTVVGVIGLVGLALVELRVRTGRLWDNSITWGLKGQQ